MFHKQDQSRNEFMLTGVFASQGYDWWWHSFTAVCRDTGAKVPFFFEFFLCNPELGGKEPVLGQLPINQAYDIKPSYLMVKAGCWGENKAQLHRFFAWDDVYVHAKAPYQVKAQNCICGETFSKGCIEVSKEDAKAHPEWMSDAGSIRWDLEIDKQIAYNVGYGASRFFRFIKAFEMYWHAEGMKSQYKGTIEYNGQIYDVIPETSYGYADKNWGRNFTSPWVWLSSNHLYSTVRGCLLKNSVFDIGGGRPKVFFLPLNRKLLGGFYYEGEEFEFNFSKFWTLPRTKFKAIETDDQICWKVWQENRTSVMKVEMFCDKKDMLLVNYESPDGKKRHNRLWNGGNGYGRIRLYRKTSDGLVFVDEILAKNVGCEYGEYDA